MKKISIISAVLCALFASQANAKNNFYVGADILLTNAKHKFVNIARESSSNDNTKIDSDSVGVGINAGYKYDIGKAFIAPEIFYDYINNSAKDFVHIAQPQFKEDTMEIDSRYGLKLNVGYNLFSKMNVFATVGAANVYYHNRWVSSGRSSGKSELTALYGLGLSYNINDTWSLRASYDRQKIDTTFVREGWRDVVRLSTARVGAVYNF